MPQAGANSKKRTKSPKPKKGEVQKRRERDLEEELEDTFPGSDPPSVTQPQPSQRAPTQPDQSPEPKHRRESDQPGDKDEKQPA
jgi:hypothetical protein